MIGARKVINHIGHNPYFNRWFSAIGSFIDEKNIKKCHNPYFNRWFSAIASPKHKSISLIPVTILILIDGFLQFIL